MIFFSGRFSYILIDGGIGNTYKSTSNVKGDLNRVIKKIREDEQFIDLLVLTHFHDDHIGGVLRWLNKDKEAPNLIKKVWFTSITEKHLLELLLKMVNLWITKLKK
ncbi:MULTISPECIES: MBL fold metallo-hydrolase [unclassified Chryseobacterium]|uniref:MBL fold metallo-hydrolase n=1 Tax=unclassified Chryseobacterium TaxID=2593645 RepID=UPI00100AF1AB|nr:MULTISPECIES: MBL fold metallo-hydrolase [unclassified Chryseobacterium]RXM50581.1 hypothetical protein BOQ64_17720 [Chryseobacterium sp. CH25]RXM63217.1 hypothetical protein BOQ60_17925 [Chryseobacterium sp. CH1]